MATAKIEVEVRDVDMVRGTQVTVMAYRGRRLRRRVWQDVGVGVLLTSEEEYQRALAEGSEAEASGFPKTDIVEVHGEREKEGWQGQSCPSDL